MNDKANAMVLASFAADALALGAHWIYNTDEIKESFGVVDTLAAPSPGSYHKQKNKGDFTHYGDQALALLEAVAKHSTFDVATFSAQWQQLFANYNGYVDHATKSTLENLAAGNAPENSGSTSTDLGGAARIAPLIYLYQDDKPRLIEAVILQTKMTHNHPATVSGAVFLARATYGVLHGQTITQAIEDAVEEGIDDMDLDIRIRTSLDTKGKDTLEVIKQFGQPCAIASALPGAVHLALSYETRLKEGCIANVMAGGDSAARGLAAGMLLGASNGTAAIPVQWLEEMNAYSHIQALLNQLKL